MRTPRHLLSMEPMERSDLYSTASYGVVQHCVVLCGTVWHCVVLCGTVLGVQVEGSRC